VSTPTNQSDALREVTASGPKTSGTARKLVQAAALTAVLVPLGSVAVESATITCGFGSAGNTCVGSAANTRTFDFGAYDLTLTFDDFVDATISITDLSTDQDTLTGEGGGLSSFPGYTCVPIAGLGEGQNCVEFFVEAPADLGFYDIFIHWDADTNNLFPNEPGNLIRILHAVGDDTYDVDITVFGTYQSDPGIGGRDDNFQRFLVAQAPIPEPATLLLVGAGVGALYHRRRRRRDAGRPPHA
jgi:hypothetical protein